jgi:peptidoglycan hydrolase CwlO-like protein
MLDDKIKKIKSAIETDDTLSKEKREELLRLSDELGKELTSLEKTHEKKSHKIAEQAQKTVDESSPEHLSNLKEVIEEFEVSHPNLTRIIQTLCAQFGV